MALLHQAEIRPSKLELLSTWLPSRPWYRGPADAAVERVAACRFDDPAGEVGIETMLVRAGDGPILHVPLTYRGAPLDGAGDRLVGTCEHSVLGRRWVYDACGDPVYLTALANAIFAGTGQADEFIEVDGHPQRREPAMTVKGSGVPDAHAPLVRALPQVVDEDPARIVTDRVEIAVVRTVGGGSLAGAGLTGTWADQPAPLVLAYLKDVGVGA